MSKRFFFLTLLVLMTNFIKGQKDTLTPFMFGLEKAQTDIERYYVLYNTHKAATIMDAFVDYNGIQEMDIEIPADAQPIPLSSHNDFGHLVLNVRNNSKACYLFELKNAVDSIKVTKAMIDRGDFSQVPELSSGTFLLLLKDDSLWVDKRQGYSYGHTRQDILFIKNGRAQNRPIMPYNTEESRPAAAFCPVSTQRKLIAGLTINRLKDCTYKTYCIDVQNEYNVEIRDVVITTPANNKYADAAIRVNNCAEVIMNHVNINGTYSQTNHYGYGIAMDNVWRSYIRNLTSRSNWGIFGCNNINEVLLDSCDINRYDIHCYGRAVTIQNCKFKNLYNQFSSVFDTIIFKNCSFTNHTPVLLESSYNAFTPFELIFDNCIFNINNKCNYIVDARDLSNVRNTRPEVAQKDLPNLTIINSKINLMEAVSKLYMFHFTSVSYTGSVGYLSRITTNGLKIHGGSLQMKVSNKDFPHQTPINFPQYNQFLKP